MSGKSVFMFTLFAHVHAFTLLMSVNTVNKRVTALHFFFYPSPGKIDKPY